MRKNIYRRAWVICLALTFSLACLSGAGQQIQGAQQTAQSAIQKGREFITTAQAFATQSNSLFATARAFATQQAPLLETAKAFATAQGPELLQTVQAASTEFAFGQTPADVPIIEQSKVENLVSSNQFISYTAKMPVKDVTDFYEQQMPANGWNQDGTRIESEGSVILQYQKGEQRAYIVLNAVNEATQVVITLESQ